MSSKVEQTLITPMEDLTRKKKKPKKKRKKEEEEEEEEEEGEEEEEHTWRALVSLIACIEEGPHFKIPLWRD